MVRLKLAANLPIIEYHLRCGFGISIGLHIKFQNTPFGINCPVLRHCQIFNMCLRCSIEVHLTGNTRKAPEVLILDIGTVAPTHHLHSDEVLARLQIFGDIELRSHLRVF